MPKNPLYVQIIAPAFAEWPATLEEFFEETSAVRILSLDILSASQEYDRYQPQVIFFQPEMLTLAITQKWKARTAADPNFRIYQMGSSVNALNDSLTPNAVFEHDVSLSHLQNGLVKTLPYPETLTVLVVDDENEIGQMICEYLSCQSAPSFKTAYCENGSLAISYLKKTTPDVLVMDVKMPVMTGIEAYAIICRTWPRLPVIIFFDAVFGDEIEKLQEIGRPAMIEKGGRQSEMPQLLATIKKKAFFR